jgi:ribosomal-protein-alanine N-acetyltransferase
VRADPVLRLETADMRRRDLRQVLLIEQAVFPEPWSQQIFSSELALRSGRSYRVARHGRRIVGYTGFMFAGDEAHVTTVAVAPGSEGRGVATTMLVEALRDAVARGVQRVTLEVAAGNRRAQALYRRFGFGPVGVRKRYYPVTGEDALVMCAEEVDSPAYARRLDTLAAEAGSRR